MFLESFSWARMVALYLWPGRKRQQNREITLSSDSKNDSPFTKLQEEIIQDNGDGQS